MQRTTPDARVPWASAPDGDTDSGSLSPTPTTSHRVAAQQALASAQRNPIMSIDQFFAVAQVNALLAIEEQLTALVAELGLRRCTT